MTEVNGEMKPAVWRPTMIPEKADLDEAKAVITRQLQPAGAEGVGRALFVAVLALEIPNVPDYLDAEHKKAFVDEKMSVYHRLLAHVPEDILKAAADAHALKAKFFPAISELMEHAGPALELRQRQAERIDRMIEWSLRPKSKPQAKPFEPEPRHVRLLTTLRWQEAEGSRLYSLDNAAKTRRELGKLAEDERVAAVTEGRAVAEWATFDYTAGLPPAPPEPEPSTPAPSIGALKSVAAAAADNRELSAEMQAALKRALAKQHRAQGHDGYAEHLEREADALAPLPPTSVRDAEEPPPPNEGDYR